MTQKPTIISKIEGMHNTLQMATALMINLEQRSSGASPNCVLDILGANEQHVPRYSSTVCGENPRSLILS